MAPTADELRIEPGDAPQTSFLWVRAQPGARRRGLAGVWNGHLKVGLGAPPQGGRANEELLEVIGEALALRARALAIASGERSRAKRLRVPLSPTELRRRLAERLGGTADGTAR